MEKIFIRRLGESSTEVSGQTLTVVSNNGTAGNGNGETTVLKKFLKFSPEEWTLEEKRRALQSPGVQKVRSYSLGPDGTNIVQAAKRWHTEMGISEKSEIKLCDLPETAVKEAMALQEKGVLAVFWTCAVFKRLHEIFFRNPGTFPFFFQYDMLLDDMQLAAVSKERSMLETPASMLVATHVSPAPLVSGLVDAGARLVDAKSNAEAAQMCEEGKVTACVTTESARVLHGLVAVHEFGSPLMVFFGGITECGLALLIAADGRADVTLPLNS